MSSIKWFHHFLIKFLNERDMTYKFISTGIGMDYNHFLCIIHGGDVTQATIDEIKGLDCFTTEDKLELQRLYDMDYCNEETRKHIDYIEKMLMSLYESLIDQNSMHSVYQKNGLSQRHSRVESVSYVLTTEILKAYNQSLKGAFEKGEIVDFEIYMHLPPVEKLLHEVYNYLSALNNCIDRFVNLKVTIAIDYDNNACEARLDSLLSFSKFIKFFTLNDFVSFNYVIKEASKSKYFIAMSDIRIEIGDKAQHATIIKDNQSAFLSKYMHTNCPLARRYSNLEYIDYILDKPIKKVSMLTSNLNTISIDLDMFDYQDICHKNEMELIDKYEKRLSDRSDFLENNQITHFITKSGLLKFLDTHVMEETFDVTGPLNDLQMISVLKKTLSLMQKNYNVRIIDFDREHDLPFLNVLRYFDLTIEDDEIIIKRKLCNYSYGDDKKINIDGRTMDYAFIISDTDIIETVNLFFKHALERVVYSRELSFDYIKKLANTYFSSNKDVRIKQLLFEINDISNFTELYQVKTK